MENNEFNKSQVIKYLLFTFIVAWLIQIGVYFIAKGGNDILSTLVMSAMMFVPFLGVLVARKSLKGMGWIPKGKNIVLPMVFSWFAPIVLTALGAVLYFLVFPSHFDASGQAMGGFILEQLEAAGISYSVYIIISIVACVTYAPIINTLLALGEEVGWRGFLYPQLKDKFGIKAGRIFGGIIWGIWHWPLIWLIGYEYGTEYFGYPVIGMLVFLVFTVALGIIEDWVYEKSGTIWVPALLHGSVNAAATLPIMFLVSGTGSAMLLGPVPNGLLAGLPMIIMAVLLFVRSAKD